QTKRAAASAYARGIDCHPQISILHQNHTKSVWHRMDFRSLRYFVQIAELGSITAAAQRLRVSQPSLTRHLHKLEQDLGVTLFVRAHRGGVLTAAGRSLLERGP